jgi:hypothetical protein
MRLPEKCHRDIVAAKHSDQGLLFCHLFYVYDITAQVLKGNSDILRVSTDGVVTNYCSDWPIRLRVESEMVEIVLRQSTAMMWAPVTRSKN